MKAYLIGSLRNENVPSLADELRDKTGFEIFDDWYAAGPEADDYWKKYESERGNDYRQALGGYAAKHVFEFDKHHLDTADVGILMCPAGKSGHLELGYILGQGKKGYILLDETDVRWDVMYLFATKVFLKKEELINELRSIEVGKD